MYYHKQYVYKAYAKIPYTEANLRDLSRPFFRGGPKEFEFDSLDELAKWVCHNFRRPYYSIWAPEEGKPKYEFENEQYFRYQDGTHLFIGKIPLPLWKFYVEDGRSYSFKYLYNRGLDLQEEERKRNKIAFGGRYFRYRYPHKFRDGPVPFTRKYRGGGFRSLPKLFGELRDNQPDAELEEYGIYLVPRVSPDYWDNGHRQNQKSWKKQRKHQWK